MVESPTTKANCSAYLRTKNIFKNVKTFLFEIRYIK